MKRFLYIITLALAFMALLCACSSSDAVQTPMPTTTATDVVIPDSSIAFIFAENEKDSYVLLYHQLAYFQMQEAGYNVSSIYVNGSSDITNVFAQLESQATEYIIVTSAIFLSDIQNYIINSNTEMHVIQYGEISNTKAYEYNIKLYEYYYLAGVALCNESSSKYAGFIASNPDEQTIRCINAFALGMKSIDIDSKVIVKWADDVHDEASVSNLVSQLYENNCDVFGYFMDGDLVEKAADAASAKCMTMSTHTFLNENNNIVIKPNINLDRFYSDIILNQNTSSFSYLGMSQNVISYEIADNALPETKKNLISAYDNLQNGYEVFSGPIYSKQGIMVPEGTSLPAEDIFDMLWFVDSVVGELPAG